MLHIHKDLDTNTCAILGSGSPAEAGTRPYSELVLLPSKSGTQGCHTCRGIWPPEEDVLCQAEGWILSVLFVAASVKKLCLFPFLLSINPCKQGSLWLIEFARRLPSVIRHPAVWAERKKRTGREANVLVSAIQSAAKFNLCVSGFCSHSTTCSDMFKMLLTHQQGGHCARTKAACFCFILCKTWLNTSLGFLFS